MKSGATVARESFLSQEESSVCRSSGGAGVGAELIAGEAERFAFLAQSDKLTENEQSLYCGLTAVREGRYALADEVLVSALQLLSRLLSKHYGQKTIILLDEYDVPLDKAFQNGHYKEMVSLIRGMLGQALKTNEFLQFAVLTG